MWYNGIEKQTMMSGKHKVKEQDTETGCQHGECLECPLPKCKYEHYGEGVRPAYVSPLLKKGSYGQRENP